MDHTSRELVTTESDQERLLREVHSSAIHSMDLTLIFNRHGDSSDAETSVKYVEPNSLVFIEGFNLESGAALLQEELLFLNYIRREFGKEHSNYRNIKAQILNAIESEIYRPALDYGDFSQHTLKEIALLLEKDCVINYADHTHIETSQLSIKQHEELKMDANDSEKYIAPDIVPGQGIGKALLQISKAMDGWYNLHSSRESWALTRTLSQVGLHTSGKESYHDITKREDGKTKAYITYGTAHTYSLSQKFINVGVEPEIVVVNPIEEYRYIEISPEEHVRNRRRKAGHRVLCALTREFLGEEETESITNELYENLNYLNHSKDEVMKFLIWCMQVRQTENEDEQKAYSILLSILRNHTSAGDRYL